MIYPEHERSIYTPTGSDKKYDPLALDRALTIASGGYLNRFLVAWSASVDGVGDVSDGAKEKNSLLSAQAEEELVKVAREAFELPAFPECMDAIALGYLQDFLEWMEKKGKRDEFPQQSPTSSQAQ